MAGVSGDFTKLRGLAKKIKGLKETQFRSRCGAVMGATALKLVSDGFRNQVDPYGKPWKPLSQGTIGGRRKGRSKKKGAKILLDSGGLRASFAYSVKGSGFNISSGKVYAAVHQFGHTFKRKARTQAQFRGRFISRARAGKLAQKRPKKGKFSLAKIGAHSVKVPRRQMLPYRKMGPTWQKKLTAAGVGELRKIKAGL